MRGETEIEPVLYFKKDKALITQRELDILVALRENGTQNKAARALGISVPVFNKRLKGLEKKLDIKLVDADPLRSRLTKEGHALLEERKRLTSRLVDREGMVIGATPILEDRLRTLLTGEGLLIISNDEHNVQMFKRGEMDLLFVDDPEFLLELTDKAYKDLVGRIVEVGRDKLLHFRKGEEYIQYGYGAQRLGFRYLESQGQEFDIMEKTLDVNHLFRSGYSFFINKSLFDQFLDRGLITEEIMDEYDEEEILMHSINAVTIKPEGEEPSEEGRIIQGIKEIFT
jgi:molybdenum-dependent DNA-binding transcriptional regulator ModE